MMPTVKPFFGCRLLQLVEHRLGHRRTEILRRQPVAAADDSSACCAARRATAPGRALRRRRDRAARRGRRAPWSARARRSRGRSAGSAARKCARRERAVQPHLQHADLLAGSPQRRRRLARRLGARAHQNDHAFGVGRAFVIEQMIVPAGQLGESVHRACTMPGSLA